MFSVLIIVQYFFWPDRFFYSQDVFDESCFHQHVESGNRKLAVGTEGMQAKAWKAVKGLKNVEYENFDILAECVNDYTVRKKIAHMKVRFHVLTSSGWKKSSLLKAAKVASSVYAQCGIYFDDINVTVVEASRRYKNINWIELYQLAAATRRDAWPQIYFVQKEQVSARSREALGLAIHEKFIDRALPNPSHYAKQFDVAESTLDYSFIENIAVIIARKRASDMGTVVAHELFHILGNVDGHSNDRTNFMFPSTTAQNPATGISEQQCATTIVAIENFDKLAMAEKH